MATHREVTRAIENKVPGPACNSKERHRWAVIDGKKVTRVTFPKTKASDIKVGTLRSIRDQLRLTSRQFEDFVHCRMTGPQYQELLRQTQNP